MGGTLVRLLLLLGLLVQIKEIDLAGRAGASRCFHTLFVADESAIAAAIVVATILRAPRVLDRSLRGGWNRRSARSDANRRE